MKKTINFIPNLITLINLLFGIFAIIFALEEWFMAAGMMIFIASILDFADGFAARLLKATSELGKQLDSLADMVSFGLAPGLLLYALLENHKDEIPMGDWWIYLAMLVPLLSALRLAKFNIDERQASSFYGLPTPSNAIAIAAFPWIANQETILFGYYPNPLADYILNPIFLGIFAIIFSFLLISELPLFSLKVKSFKFKDNKLVFSFLLFAFISFALFYFAAIPLIISIYILASLLNSKS